jgi:hypothetical protein
MGSIKFFVAPCCKLEFQNFVGSAFLERTYVSDCKENLAAPIRIRINKFTQDSGFRRKITQYFSDHRRVKEVRKRSARAAADRLVRWNRESDEWPLLQRVRYRY